jgi:pSer/pThr/pTyr-binding forkhead associated (FHA) protein
MSAYLVCSEGHSEIPLDGVVVVVGRDGFCDVSLSSPRVSRRHCCLAFERNQVLVRDLGSTNGTRINGRRIDQGVLRLGDELSIAQHRYHLEIRQA